MCSVILGIIHSIIYMTNGGLPAHSTWKLGFGTSKNTGQELSFKVIVDYKAYNRPVNLVRVGTNLKSKTLRLSYGCTLRCTYSLAMKTTLLAAFCNGLQNFPDSFLVHIPLRMSEVRTVSLLLWCLQLGHVSLKLHVNVIACIMLYITLNVYYYLLGVSLVHLFGGWGSFQGSSIAV